MDALKKNRIAAAITVNAILLIIILAAVIIYQLSAIIFVKNQLEGTKSEIARYEQLLQDKKHDLDYLQTEQGLLNLLFQQGYYFP